MSATARWRERNPVFLGLDVGLALEQFLKGRQALFCQDLPKCSVVIVTAATTSTEVRSLNIMSSKYLLLLLRRNP